MTHIDDLCAVSILKGMAIPCEIPTDARTPYSSMILVYALKQLGVERLTAYVFSADMPEGGPLVAERYPHQADDAVRHPPSAVRLTPLDRRILMSLSMHTGLGSYESVFSGRTGHQIVSDMIKTGRCYVWPDCKHALVMGTPCPAAAVWRMSADETGAVKPTFEVAEGDGAILPTAPLLWIAPDGKTCRPLDAGMPDELALRWQRKPAMTPDQAAAFTQELVRMHPDVAVPPPPHLETVHVSDTVPEPILHISRSGDKAETCDLQATLRFRYGASEIAPSHPGDRVSRVEGDRLLVMQRDREVEDAARAVLGTAGLAPCRKHGIDLFADNDDDVFSLSTDGGTDWGVMIGENLPRLEADGWTIRYAEGCRLIEVADDDWYADFTMTARGWLSFESGIRVNGQQVNLLPFMTRFLRDRRERHDAQLEAELAGNTLAVPAHDGIALIPGERLLTMLRQLFELYGDAPLDGRDNLRLDNLRAAELALTLPGTNWRPPPELVRLVEALDGALDVAPQPAPDALAATLRPYQEQGLGWLLFLESHQLGGILADDMGLGKTMQALTLLLKAKLDNRLDLPALVVAPTSVLPNWRHEIDRFAPALRYALVHGGERHAIWDDPAAYDVLLTSYGVMRRDVSHYREHMFSFVILDEAQAIKNAKAKGSRIAHALKARTRLCLTGTPVENHLGELWSLMQFAMPGLLGSETAFDQTFRKPIERDSHPVVRDVLQRRVKPLILRRTKDRVAADLPARNEIVQTIPLSDAQHDLYQAVRMAMTARIQKEMQAKGLARSRIVILDALLKLRQICCDPRLRDKKRTYRLPTDSAKLEWLSETLPEMVEEGRRILLFSQFTSMLDLIKPLLAELDVPYVEIRGSTRDRESPVRQFQAGDVPVFLISLKAGGTGLNLTAADTVIHYDPWWNPAVEAQATDRAHRIGQDKPVFVYKLIAEGTVEERVRELQLSKRALATLVGEAAETGITFSKAELDALLAPP